MKRLGFLSLSMGVLFLMAACSSGSKNNRGSGSEEDTTVVKMEVKITPEMADSMDSFLSAYYALKDAFVESDSALAIQTASRLSAVAGNLPLNKIDDPAEQQAAQKRLDSLKNEIEGLAGEDSIEGMRGVFEDISGMTYQLIKTIGLKNKTVYRTYCPMAFDDKGAYWLSNSAAIRNPFFGHKMINCGEVKQTLEF